MHLLTTSRSALGVALAAGALLASPAMARPADTDLRATAATSSLAGTVAPSQDLRGEHARDAALAATRTAPTAPRQDLRGEHARDAALAATGAAPAAVQQGARSQGARDSAWPAGGNRTPAVTAAPNAMPATGTGDDPEPWLIVALGLTGAGFAARRAAIAVRARRVA